MYSYYVNLFDANGDVIDTKVCDGEIPRKSTIIEVALALGFDAQGGGRYPSVLVSKHEDGTVACARILNLSKPNEREMWEKMLAEQKVA